MSATKSLIAFVLVLASVGAARADLGVPISMTRPVSDLAGDDAVPQVATDGHGLWIAVWQSSDPLGSSSGGDFDIVFARSVDSGQHWSQPLALNTDAAMDGRSDVNPSIATDGQGHWVVAWDKSFSRIEDDDILFARSIDNGANWSAPAPLNTNAANDTNSDSNPFVATDGQGRWIAVWDLHSSDIDVLYARSTDNGANWSAPLPLNANAANDTLIDHDARITSDGQGHWVAVWTSSAGFGLAGDPVVVRSIDGGVNWSSPKLLNANGATAEFDSNPEIVTDGNGHWVAAWESYGQPGNPLGTDGDVLVTRSLDNGANWSLPVPLNANASTDSRDDFFVRITTDGAGNWAAVWATVEDLGGIGTEGDILVARSIDDGAAWSLPAPLNSNAVGDAAEDSYPAVATDRRGEWVAVWALYPPLQGGNISAAHFGLPDCNANLIGDPTEIAAFISPDLNFNSIPDACEVLSPPPGQNGCGVGICGAGVPAFAPLMALGLFFLGRAFRHRAP